MSECQTKAGNQECFEKLEKLTLSLLLLSLSHSLTLNMLNNFCFHVYAQKSLSHTLSISHSHTLPLSHSLTLNMLNNFCFMSMLKSRCLKLKMSMVFFLHQCFLAGNQLYDWQTHGVLTLLMMMMSKNKH